MLVFIGLALAAPAEVYPLVAPVDLPAVGVSRIPVPTALRTHAEPEDASDLELKGPDGATIPIAVVRGDARTRRVAGARGRPDGTGALEWWPAPDGWIIAVRDRPLSGLDVLLPDRTFAATVRLAEQRGGAFEPIGEQLVWRVGDRVSQTLPMPDRTGLFRVQLELHGAEMTREPVFEGVRGPWAEDNWERLVLPVSNVHHQENGWVRYDVILPRPLPVAWVEPMPVEDLFDRAASAAPLPIPHAPDAVPMERYPYDNRSIQRVRFGGAALDDTRLAVDPGERSDVLSVWVESEGKPTLDIPSVTIGLPAIDLWVRDPGEGPFALYAGAPAGTRARSDLQFVAAELTRLDAVSVEPGDASPNPAYRPPELRSGTADPSSALDPKRWSTAWPVQGGPGLVRLPLPPDVLTTARGDLGDLRLVDGERRQIPYVLRADGVQHDLGALTVERRERGKTSLLEVRLPTSNLLLGSVSLTTDATQFERRVTVSRPDGGRLTPIRRVRWVGGERPERLTLDLNARFGDTLVIEIENGDNPPLPVGAIQATWPGWELLFHHPGEATLWAGAPRERSPTYDLAYAYGLDERATTRAELGPRQTLSALPASLLDRALTGIGVAVMAFGLLGLLLSLLRKVPEPASPARPADPPAEPPPTDLEADAGA